MMEGQLCTDVTDPANVRKPAPKGMTVTGMREITPVAGSHLIIITREVSAEGPFNISKIEVQLID